VEREVFELRGFGFNSSWKIMEEDRTGRMKGRYFDCTSNKVRLCALTCSVSRLVCFVNSVGSSARLRNNFAHASPRLLFVIPAFQFHKFSAPSEFDHAQGRNLVKYLLRNREAGRGTNSFFRGEHATVRRSCLTSVCLSVCLAHCQKHRH
jgi:hypothetical protein